MGGCNYTGNYTGAVQNIVTTLAPELARPTTLAIQEAETTLATTLYSEVVHGSNESIVVNGSSDLIYPTKLTSHQDQNYT